MDICSFKDRACHNPLSHLMAVERVRRPIDAQRLRRRPGRNARHELPNQRLPDIQRKQTPKM